jgi:DNA repair exonuclease SbcCD ATPase subunit
MAGDGAKFPNQLIFENVSPATRLLEKRRQMYEVQDALEAQKARFAKDEEQFKKREESLRAKDLHLQHQLIRFNKFLQDNEAKRRRAETRCADEQMQIKQKDEEIRELEVQLEDLSRQCVDLEEEVKRNMKYEEFLERAKDYSDEFSEIQDLLTRYDTLEAAHRDLVRNQGIFEQRNEEVRQEFQNYQKESANEILGFTTKTASLQSELEASETLRQQLQLEAEEATQGDSETSLKLGKIIMSVENLYLRCITQRPSIQHASELEGGTSSRDDDMGELEDSPAEKAVAAARQLGVIREYLKDFKDICEQVKKERRQQDAGGVRAGLAPEDDRLPEPTFVYVQESRTHAGAGTSSDASGSRALKTTTGDLSLGGGVSRQIPAGS